MRGVDPGSPRAPGVSGIEGTICERMFLNQCNVAWRSLAAALLTLVFLTLPLSSLPS